MPIHIININSTLPSILEGSPDGDTQNFLLRFPCRSEIDYLVYYSHELESDNRTSYIRVNYEWEYGQRARRIDLVTKEENLITLYKKTSVFATDQNALDLARLKEDISKKFPLYEIECVLIFSKDVDEVSIKQTIASLNLDTKFIIIK